MTSQDLDKVFSTDTLAKIFPAERADDFFEALYGEASEGAYDIRLAYKGHDEKQRTLSFEFELHERPGKCLACNLTYGLPEVFARHPIINVKAVVENIGKLADVHITDWEMGTTTSVSKKLHTVSLNLRIQ